MRLYMALQLTFYVEYVRFFRSPEEIWQKTQSSRIQGEGGETEGTWG
jgi:hypothetical protein